MRKGKIVLKAFTGIVMLAILIKLITSLYLETLVRDKIQSALNKTGKKYIFDIGRVHILLLQRGINFESITIHSDPSIDTTGELNGKISFVKIYGIHLTQALFHHNYHFNRLIISKPLIIGWIPFPKNPSPAILSPIDLRIDFVSFENSGLDLQNSSNSRAYRLKNGTLKLYNVHVNQKDTLSQNAIGQFQFQSEELQAVTSDSIYTVTGHGIVYSLLSKTLEIKEFSIKPNLSDNRFMARFRFETDRIEAKFEDMYIHDFQAVDYVKSGLIMSSYFKIGKMNVRVYRDKRKKFNHKLKPTFQDIIYNYHAPLKIDSIGILYGDVIYAEMVDNAKAHGEITFSNIRASIYNVTNDTVYKNRESYLDLKAEGMFMDKSKIGVLLKARLFDKENTFKMTGHLSDLELKELNPMLENSAFIVATAGKIDTMDFSFVANNTKASGKMKLLYHGLAVTVENKQTGDSTGLKQKLITFIANRKLIDANPQPGKEVRAGKIDEIRDHERFLFSYCFRSILSGIRTTVMINPPEEKKPND